jgi:hypothetical protein
MLSRISIRASSLRFQTTTRPSSRPKTVGPSPIWRSHARNQADGFSVGFRPLRTCRCTRRCAVTRNAVRVTAVLAPAVAKINARDAPQ